jgi:uncharacterized protein DUF4440
MNTHIVVSLVAGAMIPISAMAQSSPGTDADRTNNNAASSPSKAPDAAELTKLLEDFLAGASKNDAAIHERFWADELIYTSSSGKRIGKTDIMREVRADSSAADTGDTTIYSAEDIRIQQYGTTAIVAFRLVGTTKKGAETEVANYFNTGTFLKRDGRWQAVSWQATKIPEETHTER